MGISIHSFHISSTLVRIGMQQIFFDLFDLWLNLEMRGIFNSCGILQNCYKNNIEIGLDSATL